MAGYSDTRQMIIDTLMGRPAGTEIQPEDHQAFALQITDYVRSVELVAGNATPIGFADALTVPVQPDNGQALYLSQVGRGTTVVFTNFIDQSGNAISVTSDSSSVTLVNLLWNGQYWTKQETRISLENTIQENDIANGAITTPKIANKAVTSEKLADGAVTETKIADGSITGDKFSVGLTLYMNQQFNYLKQVQVQYGEDPSAAIKSFAQRDNKTALYIKLTNGLLVPANTNGETVSGLYSYGKTVRKVLFDGTNWSDAEIQSDIIDTAHIKNDAVTTNKIGDKAVTERKIDDSAVSSKKLVQGAHNPIVFTPDTTKVDNGTYDKLLSSDADVVFKDSDDFFNIFLNKELQENTLQLQFVQLVGSDIATASDYYITRSIISIDKAFPHYVNIETFTYTIEDILNSSGYLNKSGLAPVLKEIDLTGTDAERKAKLDQFETDWKNLTGVNNMMGARFVGFLNGSAGNTPDFFGVFTLDKANNYYSSICSNGNSEMPALLSVDIETGSLFITPLFSHLEAITIYTDNTAEHMQANLDNIAAYEANLQALGVADTPIGVIIPIITYGMSLIGYIQQGPDAHRNGFAVYTENTVCYEISVRGDGYYQQFVLAYQTSVDAKVDKSLNAKSLTVVNLIGTDTDRLNALKSFETNWLSLIGDEENPYGKRFIGNWEDSQGYHQGLFIQDGGYNGYCYNCIGFYGGNALGQCSNKPFLARLNSSTGKLEAADMLSHLEAITIKTGNTTSDKADNKAAIQAYVDNLKALGVDMTKGYTIPVYIDGIGSGFLCQMGSDIIYYVGVMNMYGTSSFGIAVDAAGGYFSYKLQTETDNSLTTTSKKIVGAINEVNTLAKAVKAFGAIELKASDDAANKATLTAYLKILTDAGVSTTNGYSVPVRITGNSQEYHGMLNIGTGVLLSGVVTDVNENHHYPFNVSTTDGVITFDESNYFLEKTSNEVTEMLDAIKYSHTSVPFTDTTLSNKAQLEVFLSKVPDATVMHCTYKEIWAGTLHKINGDWYGLLVKNTNSPADNINIKLSADGTVITSNSAQ